jgi:LytTr DNA-binding domain
MHDHSPNKLMKLTLIGVRSTAMRRVTGGGSVGTNLEPRLMNGGDAGTSGGLPSRWKRPEMLTIAAFSVFGLAYMIVNATSLIDERAALGRPIPNWQPWVLEASSFLSWVVLVPFILYLADKLAFKRRPISLLALHIGASLLVSITHGGLMFAIRSVVYFVIDEQYRLSGEMIEILVYEYRKDAITYAAIVIIYLSLKQMTKLQPAGSIDLAPTMLEVRDGSQTSLIKPDEIDWIEAAGNYVELHGKFGSKLARRTLTDVEDQLRHQGFVRVHRSRLVRKASISTMETRQSGDFEIELRSGERIIGSRRYRGNV